MTDSIAATSKTPITASFSKSHWFYVWTQKKDISGDLDVYKIIAKRLYPYIKFDKKRDSAWRRRYSTTHRSRVIPKLRAKMEFRATKNGTSSILTTTTDSNSAISKPPIYAVFSKSNEFNEWTQKDDITLGQWVALAQRHYQSIPRLIVNKDMAPLQKLLRAFMRKFWKALIGWNTLSLKMSLLVKSFFRPIYRIRSIWRKRRLRIFSRSPNSIHRQNWGGTNFGNNFPFFHKILDHSRTVWVVRAMRQHHRSDNTILSSSLNFM